MMDTIRITSHGPDGVARSCEQCGTPITGAQPRVYVDGVYAEVPYDYSVHKECHAAAGAYATAFSCWGEDEFPWFVLDEYEEVRAEWVAKNHPVCAARLEWPHRYDDDGELLPFRPIALTVPA